MNIRIGGFYKSILILYSTEPHIFYLFRLEEGLYQTVLTKRSKEYSQDVFDTACSVLILYFLRPRKRCSRYACRCNFFSNCKETLLVRHPV